MEPVRNLLGIGLEMQRKNKETEASRIRSGFYTLTSLTKQGKILKRLLFRKNEKDLEEAGERVGFGTISSHFYKKDTLYYWEYIYDTIWQISPLLVETPKYVVNYGKNKLPTKFILKRNAGLEDELNQYVKLIKLIADKNLFYFSLVNKVQLVNVIYDLSNGTCVNVKSDDPITGLPDFALNNDIDGGLSYWPVGQVNDSTTFSMVYGYMLHNKIGEHENKTIREIVNQSEQFDNPILMLVVSK